MQEKIYREQIAANSNAVDLDFWRHPEGISVPDDELRFLLVPDLVESLAIGDVAQQVHDYQAAHSESPELITKALIVTMGGMLPGILLHDHLINGQSQELSPIEFGTIGISLYKGPNERFDHPHLQQAISIPILDETVLIIDDLGDRGGTMEFLTQHIAEKGAKKILTLALYMKPMALSACPVDFFFGEVQQNTWIITPRECVETMVKRVPIWKSRGANIAECRRRLVDLIGYPQTLTDYYLKTVFAAG